MSSNSGQSPAPAHDRARSPAPGPPVSTSLVFPWTPSSQTMGPLRNPGRFILPTARRHSLRCRTVRDRERYSVSDQLVGTQSANAGASGAPPARVVAQMVLTQSLLPGFEELLAPALMWETRQRVLRQCLVTVQSIPSPHCVPRSQPDASGPRTPSLDESRSWTTGTCRSDRAHW